MTGLGDAELPSAAGTALFLLSFRHRDELAAAADRAGWRAIAARRALDAERRFLQSGAQIAVVDARGAFDDGLAAVRALADPVQANAAALLALVSRTDVERLGEIHAAGATHYLASPFGEAELAQALLFAARHAERLGVRVQPRQIEPLAWSGGADGVVLSPGLARLIDAPAETLPVRAALMLLGAEGRAALRAGRRRLSEGRGTTAVTLSLAGGGRVALHLSVRHGRLSGLVERLSPDPEPELAFRDALTGLHDGGGARRWMADRLRAGERPALLLVGLTRFNMLNTAYGRVIGDALLQAAARRIARVPADLGRKAFVARMAGTEFLIGVARPDADTLRELAEQVLAALERRFVAGPDMVSLGVTIGGVTASADEQPAMLLRRASIALAEAREGAAGPICLHDPEAAQAVSRAERLAAELRQAIAGGQVDIVFQPQVSIASGAITGVEALARWHHPDFGDVGAEALFTAAARANHLVALSEHVQHQAMAIAAAWPGTLAWLRLSVNVTAEELHRPGFAPALLARADAAGFPRRRLTIEVTETGLIEDLGAAAEALATLRAAGCRVAIDDFGTGYSSLAYLKALPLDYLKIDKGLTQDIAGSNRDRVVVRGVIDMARSLGLGVIAEGVETEAQLAALTAEGCTLYQGYLCSEPIDGARLAALVRPPVSPGPATAAMPR
ncbi:EAL domain-containing protein [Sphingomonas changnyeongensis]|uniref:EAL domain-containing protein n=1 Tax=Sphingomonas changnyeongensis TaxID=2698679 RepID=A0A7Z2NWJ4_9SPHN|nr:bifunctional diguanylate cyclase/phosphodiesterase [Sphingomonas changnyeongensis]QHL91057.1 EAL domain-containing protein [Sphingomonas changnyeongensis]